MQKYKQENKQNSNKMNLNKKNNSFHLIFTQKIYYVAINNFINYFLLQRNT